MRAFVIAFLLLSGASARGADSDYVGAQVCGGCHKDQFTRQSAGGHAQALRRATEHPLAAEFTPPAPLLRPPNFRFRFARMPQGIEVQADDSKYLTRLPVEWAFGAGVQAVTFVGKASDELYLEHSFSYYSDTRSFDITPHHEGLPAATLHQAMGQALRTQGPVPGIRECFQCHSTGPVSMSPEREIRINEAGVRCEVCHGPGRAHAQAAAAGDLPQARKLIQNPKTLAAVELNRMCGSCHRFLEGDGRTTDWNDPWNARHQPPYLQQSACFRKSDGALSCLTCHNPHEKLSRIDPAYYSRKCSSCHDRNGLPPRRICKSRPAAGCAGCHMPAVAANAHLKFTNHWIGVYRDGATLKPSR
jgi:hypothetical protein